MFYFKILILIFSYIFCQLPNSYHIDNLDENSRDLINGWPSKSILDLAIDSHGNIFAGTSGGIAKIVDVDLSSNETIEESLYIVSDANLPSGGNPSMEVFELDNANSLIVVSGVIGTIEEPIGTGLAWSINNGESWQHIFQPQDSENDSKFTSEWIIPNCGEVTPCKANVIENREWCGQTFTHLAVTTSTKNVSYDVSADVINGYIYAASWGGMLRRFKYTDSNPIWEVIPLPMDEQDELKCSDGTGYSDSYYYSPIDPDRGQYNHKPFSVHIVKDDLDNQVQWIWVGTADGINKGRIQNGQIGIDWTHYKNIEESEQFLDDWVTGIYSQKLQDDTGNNLREFGLFVGSINLLLIILDILIIMAKIGI